MPDAPPRVLQVSLWLLSQGGGVQTYIASMAASLHDSTLEVRHGAVMPGTVPDNVREPVHFGKPGRPKWTNALRLWRWLRRELPAAAVVHVHGALGWPLLVAGIACTLARVPFVVSTHGALYPWYLVRQPLKMRLFLRLLGRHLLRRAAAVVANTPAEARIVRDYDPRLPVVVVPPGIELPRPRAGVPGGAQQLLRVASVGRLEPMKGLPVLLDAVAGLRAEGIAVALDLIGKGVGDHGERLREQARRLGIADAVTFHGYVGDDTKRSLLERAHVLAVPSHAEAFSFVTAEALALGLPAVVTTAVALAETVERYQCGAVVPTDDARRLARALADHRDPATLANRAACARRCAESEFSLAAMGRALDALYRDVAAKR